jgi:hypothetical protein
VYFRAADGSQGCADIDFDPDPLLSLERGWEALGAYDAKRQAAWEAQGELAPTGNVSS